MQGWDGAHWGGERGKCMNGFEEIKLIVLERKLTQFYDKAEFEISKEFGGEKILNVYHIFYWKQIPNKKIGLFLMRTR